jgi:hypothetical protein
MLRWQRSHPLPRIWKAWREGSLRDVLGLPPGTGVGFVTGAAMGEAGFVAVGMQPFLPDLTFLLSGRKP